MSQQEIDDTYESLKNQGNRNNEYDGLDFATVLRMVYRKQSLAYRKAEAGVKETA